MSTFIPFNPAYTSGQTKTSAALAASFSVAAGTNQVCITNTGSYIAYVRIGVGSFSATTADYPVLAGSQVVLTKAQDDTAISHISASGTTLHFICGSGFR
jgi:hypothetical protein